RAYRRRWRATGAQSCCAATRDGDGGSAPTDPLSPSSLRCTVLRVRPGVPCRSWSGARRARTRKRASAGNSIPQARQAIRWWNRAAPALAVTALFGEGGRDHGGQRRVPEEDEAPGQRGNRGQDGPVAEQLE